MPGSCPFGTQSINGRCTGELQLPGHRESVGLPWAGNGHLSRA
ncbi:hypothetical protein [Hydrogenophaga sp. YM1]|nr:hypothetical protein [Hydrogenophaga sp. YM1]